MGDRAEVAHKGQARISLCSYTALVQSRQGWPAPILSGSPVAFPGDPVHRFLSRPGGVDGQPLVRLQRLQPALDVRRRVVDRGGRDAGEAAQARGGELGHQFLLGVRGRAERGRFGIQPAVEAGRVPGGVPQFVEQGGVILLGAQEPLGPGDADFVVFGSVAGLAFGVHDAGPVGVTGNEPFGRLARRERAGRQLDFRICHAFGLLDVEGLVASQDGQLLGLPGLLVGDGELFPEDDRDGLLTFANVAAAVAGLFEDQPPGAGIAGGPAGEREQEQVDPAARCVSVEVFGKCSSPLSSIGRRGWCR